MKAIDIEKDQLILKEFKNPIPGAGEVLIKVAATAVNRADLVQRSGAYPPPRGASQILGLECSGEVMALGDGEERFKVGDKVCALLTGGGYAEQVTVPSGQVLPIPSGFDLHLAAAIPEVFCTAYLNLYKEANLIPKEKVLLHAGASGVGTAAIQLCKASGNPCFITAGNTKKIKYCQDLGADGGTVRDEEGFLEEVSKWTEHTGVDVILDPVGATYLADNLKSLAIDGRLVLIGLMGGIETKVDLSLVLMKRIRLIGSTLRARSVPFKTKLMEEMHKKVWPLFEKGEIKPVIDKYLALEHAEEAHKFVASNKSIGKVVLTLE